MLLLLDADSCVYSAGFSTDKQWVSNGGQLPSPISHSCSSVKNVILKILQNVPHEDVGVYLTGKGNFRNEIAKTKVYKGNRNPEARPSRYNEIREYLQKRFAAEVVEGFEADDRIAMLHCPGESVVVSIDKDLRQLPGLHYDWKKELFIEIDESTAARNFWVQVLVGDVSDNVPGLKGVGHKTAAKLLPYGLTYEDYASIVKTTYEKYFKNKLPKESKERQEMLAMELLTENGKLLHLLRHEKDIWEFPI